MQKRKVAIIGWGNIGTHLMIKIVRVSDTVEVGAMLGIDPGSDGAGPRLPVGLPHHCGGVDGPARAEKRGLGTSDA